MAKGNAGASLSRNESGAYACLFAGLFTSFRFVTISHATYFAMIFCLVSKWRLTALVLPEIARRIDPANIDWFEMAPHICRLNYPHSVSENAIAADVFIIINGSR